MHKKLYEIDVDIRPYDSNIVTHLRTSSPYALLIDLSRYGIDLSECRRALDEIEEEQRQKQEEERRRLALAKRAGLRGRALGAWRCRSRRFVIAYNKAEDNAEIKVAEGMVYSDGIACCGGDWPAVGGESIEEFKKFVEGCGYECSIEFID